MGFSDVTKGEIKSHYTENLIDDFYKPLLSEANLYQRVSGYFTTAGMDLYIDGIEELAKNNGKIEFIISKTISEEDFNKIKSGYKLYSELESLKMSERNERLNPSAQKQLGNLAFLIANGRARVKIALTNEGIFHDKFGIISSGTEKVFFNGSVNETYSGMNVNYESISVDVSWDESSNVINRIESNVSRFNRLWNNLEPGVVVIEASDIAYTEIAKYQSQSDIIEEITDISVQNELLEEMDTISFNYINNRVIRFDNSEEKITNKDRKLKKGSDISIFFESDNSTIRKEVTYKDLERIIRETKKRAKRLGVTVVVSEEVNRYISRNKYSIEQYKIIGDVYKGNLDGFPSNKEEDFYRFSDIVQSEVERPLYDIHLRASFYKYEMGKAANFSVPGAGKTAMILGIFAYLNSGKQKEHETINRILVVCPISAFESWKYEFKTVFGFKKALSSIDCQSSNDFTSDLNLKWKISNLVLINYESLDKYVPQLEEIIDSKTMLVFDEVHRVKKPSGVRSRAALEISRTPVFKYVLTGTPIPNSYKDIYVFLHILYANEYSSFFGWELNNLADPRVRQIGEINERIHPFFWRTNKNDLNVPKPEPDVLEVIEASEEQKALAEAIYYNETSSLARLIRLMQASTNPSLLSKTINYRELMLFEEESDISSISESKFDELLGVPAYHASSKIPYSDFDLDSMISTKYERAISLISELVSEGKKVLVWGIFVDTLKKATKSLQEKGIKVNLVYGGTDKSIRENLINEFRYEDVQVLVSNPQTLGEAISLHQNVHDAVYLEYNYNLTFMLQSRDRIHRLGLEPNQYTRYYYLKTKDEEFSSYRPGYIDQKIYNRLKEKEEIMYSAIDNNTLSIDYTENEILDAIEIIEAEKRRIKLP